MKKYLKIAIVKHSTDIIQYLCTMKFPIPFKLVKEMCIEGLWESVEWLAENDSHTLQSITKDMQKENLRRYGVKTLYDWFIYYLEES